jgi:hypothetical protein
MLLVRAAEAVLPNARTATPRARFIAVVLTDGGTRSRSLLLGGAVETARCRAGE